MMASQNIDDALSTLKGVFLVAPSARLSVDEACRLTGLDGVTCLELLLALEHARFLWRSRTGWRATSKTSCARRDAAGLIVRRGREDLALLGGNGRLSRG